MATGIWRLFRRGKDDDDGEGKATRAHLGEENQFYYNKELKRWLIRGEEHLVQQQEAPPPPPAAAAPSGAAGSSQRSETPAPNMTGMTRMRARGAASLYTATPGLMTKNRTGSEGGKRPPTFVMPPFRLQQHQHLQHGTDISAEDPKGEGAASAAEAPPADNSHEKDGCRVRTGVPVQRPAESGEGESEQRKQQLDQPPRQQCDDARVDKEGAVTEPSQTQQELPPLEGPYGECSTGVPSPPQGRTRALLQASEGRQQQQPQLDEKKERQEGRQEEQGRGLNGARAVEPQQRRLQEEEALPSQETGYWPQPEPPPQQQPSCTASSAPPPSQGWVSYVPAPGAVSEATSAVGEEEMPEDAQPASKPPPAVSAADGEYDILVQSPSSSPISAHATEDCRTKDAVLQPQDERQLQQEQQEPEEQQELLQQQERVTEEQQQKSFVSQRLLRAPETFWSSSRSTGLPHASEVHVNSDTDGFVQSRGSCFEGNAAAFPADTSVSWDTLPRGGGSPASARLQRPDPEELAYMEAILPGFAEAVRELERSSKETLRHLAAMQDQVGFLRSRHACMTTNMQVVVAQLLSGEGPTVERREAAQLLQSALAAVATDYPSPTGSEAFVQSSPACSGASDRDTLLEEAQQAMAAMERNRRLQEEDVEYDAEVTHFVSKMKETRGSLEPALYHSDHQRNLLQQACKQQHEHLEELRCMYEDVSRQMEENCARVADLEGQLAATLQTKQQLQQQQEVAQEQLQQQQQMLQHLQQQNELATGELQQQTVRLQEQLTASEEELSNLQQQTEQQQQKLHQLQTQLDEAAERETAASAAAEAAKMSAEDLVAEERRAKEQLQQQLEERMHAIEQQLQHREQLHEQQKQQLEQALMEKQEALDSVAALQHQDDASRKQQLELLEKQLLSRELMLAQLQAEVNQSYSKQQQQLQQHEEELQRQRQQHETELQQLAARHAEALEQQKQQAEDRLQEEQRNIVAFHQANEDRLQQNVQTLQQQLQQEQEQQLLLQQQQEALQLSISQSEQRAREAQEQIQVLQQHQEANQLLLDQHEKEREQLNRELQSLQQKHQAEAAAAEQQLEQMRQQQQQLQETITALEAERNELQQQVERAVAAAQQQLEEHEPIRQQHEQLQQQYESLKMQMQGDREEQEERIRCLETQLEQHQGLLQAAREELLQQPTLLQQKHEEDIQQQLAALRQLEREERKRLQQEHDQSIEQLQEKHALLTQQLREQHALERQQQQQRMQQQQQEQQEALRSHFEHLWNEESAKMVAANSAVVEQLQQAQQLLLEEQKQLEASEAQREALAREREEAASLKAQLLAAKAETGNWEKRCAKVEQQLAELLKSRSSPEAETQVALETEVQQLRQQVNEKQQLSQQLQQQLDEHIASHRDRLGEVNAMLERQEEASKQKDLRLRSVEEELQSLQQLLQDTVDVKQLEAARAEVAESHRRVQKLEADLAAAAVEQDSLKMELEAAREKIRKQQIAAENSAGEGELGQRKTEEGRIEALPAWEALKRQAQKTQQRNEELTVRNTTLTRISDFLSRRLQFFERALAEMGPQGLMVVEDCDRTVVLSPAPMDAVVPATHAPELLTVGESAPWGEERHSDRSSSETCPPSRDAVSVAAGHADSTSGTDSPIRDGDAAVGASARAYTGVSHGSASMCRNSRNDPASPTARSPPKPPAFLTGVAAPPKA